MSHNKERAEKVCLNCGADLHGRYCHQCGQENLEPKESLWHLVTHYANDITHFDGKFFSTLKYLILRPGFLPAEYLKGKRASYLHPIRMYVFTSAFFFIIFFALFHTDHRAGVNVKWMVDSSYVQKIQMERELLENAKTKKDSARIQKLLTKLEVNNILRVNDTAGVKNKGFGLMASQYKTEKAYDSVQKALPETDRDGWVTRRLMHRSIYMYHQYNGDGDLIMNALVSRFTHLVPQMLFISLPLFAFVLWLMYIRRKNEFFYTGHVIFTLYLYIFYFIAYLLFFILQKAGESTGWGIWGWIGFALWLYMTYYMYKALRNFYRQRRLKTIIKLLLLMIANLFIFIILFVVFLIFTVYQV